MRKTGKINVSSESVVFTSRSGVRLSGFIDQSEENNNDAKTFVVLSPKYGETKKNNLAFAYEFAANGLTTLRFDHAYHLGESDGVKTGFTLPGGVDDILGAIDYAVDVKGAEKIILVASSLSGRTAIRAAAEDDRIDALVCMVGVVNVRHTLFEVYKEDLVANHLDGKRWGVTDILGVEIDFDRFLETAVETGMHDLQGTEIDLKRIQSKVILFPAEKDTWVLLDEVRRVTANHSNVEIYPIPDAMHEIRENPQAAAQATRDLIRSCLRISSEVTLSEEDLFEADRRSLMQQNKIEREGLKASNPITVPEKEFWATYLEKYQMLSQVADYRSYLDTVGRLIGPVNEGDVVLDAGCGNGLFGVWLMREIVSRVERDFELPPVYVALDLTLDGLWDALRGQAEVVRRHARRGSQSLLPEPGRIYRQIDLDCLGQPLDGIDELVRFEDGCFDKICCSLVLSYLKDPTVLLKELYRILKPGGTIVISSMKPFCDMSMIYRDFMEQQVDEEELASGRQLLSAAGEIKVKEEYGVYHFYAGEELAEAVSEAGFPKPVWENSFGNQAVAVMARK